MSGLSLPELREAPRKERPILFSGPLVRAILEGRKTQTRRLIKDAEVIRRAVAGSPLGDIIGLCKYGQPGDRLWVRETFALKGWDQGRCSKAGFPDAPKHPTLVCDWSGDPVVAIHRASCPEPEKFGPWKPSIHMPRWASRITLEVTGVRVERLGEISDADAVAEGMQRESGATGQQVRPGSREAFAALWEDINGAWDPSLWVWVISFRRVEVPHV